MKFTTWIFLAMLLLLPAAAEAQTASGQIRPENFTLRTNLLYDALLTPPFVGVYGSGGRRLIQKPEANR